MPSLTDFAKSRSDFTLVLPSFLMGLVLSLLSRECYQGQ